MKMQIDISKSPGQTRENIGSSQDTSQIMSSFVKPDPRYHEKERTERFHMTLGNVKFDFKSPDPQAYSQNSRRDSRTNYQSGSNKGSSLLRKRLNLKPIFKKEEQKIDENFGILVQNQHISARKKKTRIDVQSTLRSAKVSDPTESNMNNKRNMLDTLRTSFDGRREKPEIKEEYAQYERPTTQVYQSSKTKFKATQFKIDESHNNSKITEKAQRLLSQQEFKRPANPYGLLSDQKNSRNVLSSCKAAIKRPSVKNTFFTMGQLARNSNCSTAVRSVKQTEGESGASVTDPTMVKKPDSTLGKKRIKLDTLNNSDKLSEETKSNFNKTDALRDYIPHGLQPLNFVVAQANEKNPYHTQEFDRSLMSGQDTKRKGVKLDQIKKDKDKKLAKLDINFGKTAPRSVHDSINRESQRDGQDKLLGNYKASNFGAFRSKWVASRYEMKRVFSRESKCRGCKLEQIAQKVLTSQDMLKSVQARTSLNSREENKPFFEKRRNQQHPFSTLSGYEHNSVVVNQRQKKVSLKLAHIEGIQSSTLDASLIDITKMRHSTNQSPSSLLVDAHIKGTGIRPSFIDKFESKRLSKHQSQQPSTSMEKPPIQKACVSTDLADVADHGLDNVEISHKPAPIGQQDDMTPEEVSESKTDAQYGNTKNLTTQEAILSSNPSKGKIIMSQIEKQNVSDPETALIGHRALGKSSDIFDSQDNNTIKKQGESEGSKLSRNMGRRQPLTIPAPDPIGSDIKTKEDESPSPPSYKLKVNLEEVTNQRVLEEDDYPAPITDKIVQKSIDNTKSQQNVQNYADISNPDLKSIEKRPSDVEIIENLISKTTPRNNSKQKLNKKRTAQHLQQAAEYYQTLPQDDINSQVISDNVASSNLMITAGQGDVNTNIQSTLNTNLQSKINQIHFEDKDNEYGDQTPKVVVHTRPFQSHQAVNLQLIDQLLYSPTDGTVQQSIMSVDQKQKTRQKNHNKFGKQIHQVLKKYGVLEALDRIDMEQEKWDEEQKAKFDKDMDIKFQKVMGKILNKRQHRAASVPKQNVPPPITIQNMATLSNQYDKKVDNSPEPMTPSSDAKSHRSRRSAHGKDSAAGSTRNLHLKVQQVSSKSRESIKRRRAQQQTQHHNHMSINAQESPLQIRLPSYPNSVSPTRERNRSPEQYQYLPQDFVLPSSKYLKDFFNTQHVKKMSDRQAQDTFRLKNMSKSDRIQHVQRQQIFADRYQQLPDNPKKWRKERNKELIRTITKKLQNSTERSKITEEDDDMSIETISNMTESSHDSQNVHEQSPQVRNRNKMMHEIINGLEAKKLAETTMSSQEKKGEIDTTVQITQNSLALRRLQTTLTQHVLVPKPNFFEMNQERLDHFVELNDNLGPIDIEVFGKTITKEPLPYLMRLRGVEFNKLYIIQIKPHEQNNNSQDLNMTLEYPFQVDQHWYCDDVNLHKSHTIKIIARPQQPQAGVPQQDVNEFNVFLTLVSKSGCDVSIQLICPEKERERNRQQVVAKMMQQMSGKSKNPKAKSKHALAAVLKMTKSQVKDVEDDLKNYLKTQRPDWVPSDEVVQTHEMPHYLQKNIDELHLANEFNYLQERKDKAYEKELMTIQVQKRKQLNETMKINEHKEYLGRWEKFKQEETLAKEVLIKLLKHGMVVKRWVTMHVFGQIVEKCKDIFKMIQEKKKKQLAAATIAVRLFILLKRNHKRLGASTQIRTQKIYFHFHLPLQTTLRIDTIQHRAKQCFLTTLRKSLMIHQFEKKVEYFGDKVTDVQQHFRQMMFKRMCRSKVIMNLFNRERATLLEIIGKKMSNPGSYAKALTKLQKKLPLLAQEEIANMITELIRFKQCQSLEKFLELKTLIQKSRIKFLIYLKRNSYNINRGLMGFVGKDNGEILEELSNRIDHSQIKIKRWQGIIESLKDRMFDLSSTLFGSIGPKDFMPMLIKQSTKLCMNRLDQLYPKEAPKGKKGKKSQQIKLFPSLEEERQKAIQIQRRIESKNKVEKTKQTLQANIEEIPPPMMKHHNMIMDESEMPVLEWEQKAKLQKQVTDIVKAAQNYEDNECSVSEDEDAWKDCDTCYDLNKITSTVSPTKKEGNKKGAAPAQEETKFKKVIERCDNCKQKKLKRLDKKFDKVLEFYNGSNFIVLFKTFHIARSDHELRDQFHENIEWAVLNPTKEEIIRMVIQAANNMP